MSDKSASNSPKSSNGNVDQSCGQQAEEAIKGKHNDIFTFYLFLLDFAELQMVFLKSGLILDKNLTRFFIFLIAL